MAVGSLSARRAWIEITHRKTVPGAVQVALRKESVDRNLYYGDDLAFADGVALRKESVDRNQPQRHGHPRLRQSLSARRAWIEISCSPPKNVL